MKVLVTYKSKTGFTKEYAEEISKRLSADCMEIKKAKKSVMGKYDVVIHGGSIFAGMIGGLKEARADFAASGAKKFVVFAVGATPAKVTDNIRKIEETNITPEEKESGAFFYFQGGLRYDKMGFMSRRLMKMMANQMKKGGNVPNDDPNEVDISESYDISSPEYVVPLVDYVNSLNV